MFINKNSIYINNVSMGQYLLQAKYERNKLWASDTGRNLEGDFSGTLKGIFPKFVLTFRKLSQSELETISPILDSGNQTFEYYSPTAQTNKTISTYSSDWNYTNKYIGVNDSFECSFTAKTKEV